MLVKIRLLPKALRVNKFFYVLFIFGFFASTSVAASEQKSYFAKISGVISPFLEYKPILPLNKADISSINHYVVTSNDKGQLLSIRYFEGEFPSNHSYFGTHEVRYSYSKQGKSRHYFNTQGEKSTMWRHYYQGGDIHEERYSKEKDLEVVKLYSSSGNAIESGIGTHRLVKKELDERRYLQRHYKLDGTSHKFRNSMPFEAVIITTYPKGFLHKTINVDPKTLEIKNHPEAGYAYLEVLFDENGVETGWEYRNAEGNLVDLTKQHGEAGIAKWAYYTEWQDRAKGIWSSYTINYYDKNGRSVPHQGVYNTRYFANNQGNYTGVEYWNHKGKLTTNQERGFARMEIIYSENGLRIEDRLYNISGELLSSGTAIKRYTYDDNRNRTGVKEYNAVGDEITSSAQQ